MASGKWRTQGELTVTASPLQARELLAEGDMGVVVGDVGVGEGSCGEEGGSSSHRRGQEGS